MAGGLIMGWSGQTGFNVRSYVIAHGLHSVDEKERDGYVVHIVSGSRSETVLEASHDGVTCLQSRLHDLCLVRH